MNKEENTKPSTSTEVEWPQDSEKILKLKQAGAITKQVADYAKTIIKPNTPLLEIAEKIENKITELKAKPAFPVNLSINEIAAHSTPDPTDQTLATGLLKIDIGVHIDGYVADTAFSLDLENSEENKQLIKAAEDALKAAIETIELNTPINQIGEAITQAINNQGAIPIHNLSGHEIEQYNLHAGLTIPNFNNSQTTLITQGLYAIEPFTTPQTASGKVKDGKPSGIYKLENPTQPRDPLARQILAYIIENYQTLPFCQRWIHKQFGPRTTIALHQLEQNNSLHQYPQLIESTAKKVAQAEHTILITDKEKIVTTQ